MPVIAKLYPSGSPECRYRSTLWHDGQPFFPDRPDCVTVGEIIAHFAAILNSWPILETTGVNARDSQLWLDILLVDSEDELQNGPPNA